MSDEDIDHTVASALAQHRVGRHDAARALYREVLDREPEQPDALHWLGVLAMQEGDVDEAFALIVRSLEIRPTNAEALNNLGNLLTTIGQPDQALPFFNSAVELEPDFAEAHYNRARALREIGELAEAMAGYMRALEIRADYLEAVYQLGETLADLGEKAQAIACFRTALTLDPEDRAGARLALAALGAEATPERAGPAFVRSLFDRYAEDFDLHLSEQLAYRAPEILDEALAPFWDRLPPTPAGLDLGCGTGLGGVPFRARLGRLDGIDVSPLMVEKARERGIYDELVVGDLIPAMEALGRAYDLVLAADVLVYFGDLTPLFTAIAKSLAPAGLLAVTVEASPGEEVQVHGGLRFAHTEAHVRAALAAAALAPLHLAPCATRREADQPVAGYVVVAGRAEG